MEIVFLTPWAPYEADRTQMGITSLSGRFRVTVADLSPLLAPEHPRPAPAADVVRLESYAALDAFLLEKKGAIFFDYVLGSTPILLKQERLFRALGRHGIRYIVLLASSLPVPSAKNSGLFKKIFFRLRTSVGLPGYLADLTVKRFIGLLRRRGLLYARPWRVYAVNHKAASGFISACGLEAGLLRSVNSFDYSLSLEARRQGYAPVLKKTCVLIDENLVDSRDFAYAGLKALTAEEFYTPLNAFLGKIEKELGLEPVIAAHPKTRRGVLEEKYPGRRVIYGGTMQTIAEASLVLAHWSTALSFAVIFDKPALLLKTRGMEETGLSGFVDTLAGALGVRILRPEEAPDTPLDFTPESLPRACYREYLALHIKPERAPDATVWDTVAGDLEAL